MDIGTEERIRWESDIPSRHPQLLWTSETPQVASVDETGLVTAHNVGKTSLIGDYSSMKWSVEVEVLQKILYGTMGGALDYAEPSVTAEQNFEELIIYNKPWDNQVFVDQTFVVGAIPHPLDMWGDGVTRGYIPNYALHWTSSDPSVARIKNGIIQPLKVGKTTITATIQGTNLTDSFELKVATRPVFAENFSRPSASVFDGLNSSETMQKIFDLITSAKENGFNGIIFPRMDYHVQPVGLSAFKIPSNFTVDFNYSNMYMDSWHDYVNGNIADGTQNRHYTLFSFEDAEFSVFKNLNYYGERYSTTHTESEYGEQTLFFYTGNGYYCDMYNCYYEGVAGFHICVGGEEKLDAEYLYAKWEDDAYKYANKVEYHNLSRGFLKPDGSVDTNVSNHIYTPNFVKINRTYFANYGKYAIGTTYTARFGSIFNFTRFYNIAWYDEDQNLLEYREKQMVFYDYDLPEGALYYKLTCFRPTYIDLPTANDDPRLGGGNHSCVCLCYPAKPAYCCSIYNCEFKNTASGCVSGTGNSIGFRFYNNNLNGRESVGKRNAWCYDFEDGWWAMFGNIYQNNSDAFRCAFAGVLNTVMDSGNIGECYNRVLQDGKFFHDGTWGAFYNDDCLNGMTNYPWEANHTGYGYICGHINIVSKEGSE